MLGNNAPPDRCQRNPDLDIYGTQRASRESEISKVTTDGRDAMYTEQPQLLAEIVETTPQPVDRDKALRLRGVLTQLSLRDEKVLFEQTRTGLDESGPWARDRLDAAQGPADTVH